MRYKLCRCGAVREDREGVACRRCGAGCKARNTKEHGYDNKWRRLSERVRIEEPLCQVCLKQGIVTPASEVHHVIPIDEAPWLRLERSNLMSVCTSCHKVIHADDASGRVVHSI